MDHRAVQDLEPSRPRRLADDDLRDVVGLRETDHVVRDAAIAAGNGNRFAAECLGQPQRIRDPVALFLAPLQAAPCLHVERRERCMQPVRQPFGIAHEAGRPRIFAHAGQDALARRPRPRDRMGLHVREQLLVDAFRGAAQRQLAQRRQVAGREVVIQRALGLLGNVDLPLLEPFDEVVRGQIDELDGVGAVEHRIGDRLAHTDMGDLGNDVIEALDMLDIDCRVDVDAAMEQFLDVEVALGMTTAGRVGMGQFVDQRDLRAARDDGVEVHLLERLALVVEPLAGNDLQSVEERLRLLTPMRFEDANDDIVAVLFPGARLLQHLVGLADAGSGADKNLEPAGSSLLPAGGLEQGLRRRSLVRVAVVLHHQEFRFSAGPA